MFYVGEKLQGGIRVGLTHKVEKELTPSGIKVIRRDYGLNPRFDIVDYAYSDANPDEADFDWGSKMTPGSLQLALGLLANAFDDDIARKHHIAFAKLILTRMKPLWFFNREMMVPLLAKVRKS